MQVFDFAYKNLKECTMAIADKTSKGHYFSDKFQTICSDFTFIIYCKFCTHNITLKKVQKEKNINYLKNTEDSVIQPTPNYQG